MRSMLPVAMLVTLLTLGSSAAGEAPGAVAAPPAASLSGQLAFSDTIVFDYNRDGTPDRAMPPATPP